MPQLAPTSAPPLNDPLQVGAPLPETMGLCADFYHDVRELRLAMEKELKAVAAREAEVREYIIGNLAKSRAEGKDSGAAGLRFRAQVKDKEVAKIMQPVDAAQDYGWHQLWAFIQQTGRFDLLQKRLSEKAIKDMWEQGEVVPGVEKMLVPDVSITKI